MPRGSVLSEQEVLNLLKIPDFRHLSKNSVMSFASLLDRMDPEISKKALDQFPSFAETVKTVVQEYGATVKTCMDSNNDSMKNYLAVANANITVLQKELERDNLSSDDRKYILSLLLDVQRMMGEKDSENKAFLLRVIGGVGLFCAVAIGITASIIGGNSSIDFPKKAA